MKTVSSAKLPRREFGGETAEQKQRPLMLKDFLNGQNSMKRRHLHGSSNEVLTTMRHLLTMDSRSKNKIHKESVILSCNPASSTLSALHKASATIIKILPFSIFSRQSQTATIPTNRFGSFIRRVASLRESNKGSISQRVLAAMRGLSYGDHGSGDEMKVRVRDIMQWRSFGDEKITYENYFSSKSPPRAESNRVGGTSDSWSSSPTSSCRWSERDCFSNLQSSSGSSVCSAEACGMKDKTPLLNYCINQEEGVEIKDNFQKGSCCASDGTNKVNSILIDHEAISGTEADIQEVERVNDGCMICCNVEGYEEKEQFSPVSVLDFPFEDEDEVATSPFEESIPSKERTKRNLSQRIRQYEDIAECSPVDLEEQFLSSHYELADEDFQSLTNGQADDSGDLSAELENVEYIKDILIEFLDAAENRRWESFELLVIDIFREELSFHSELEEDKLVRVTVNRILDWLAEESESDECGKLCLKEMERNEDWRKFRTDEEALAAAMEAAILCSLMDDLLIDAMD